MNFNSILTISATLRDVLLAKFCLMLKDDVQNVSCVIFSKWYVPPLAP